MMRYSAFRSLRVLDGPRRPFVSKVRQHLNQLEGRVALVTGASKGIGAGIARELAARGASVIVNYSTSKSGADHVVAEILAAGGTAAAVQGNVSHPSEIDAMIAAGKTAFGKIDIVVNNAGVYAFTPLETLTTDVISSMLDVNVTGLLLTTRAAVALFPPDGGSIINIGSVVGEIAPAMASVYAGTKAAINAITRVLAKELAPKKIRVNAVNPGAVATEGFTAAGFAGSQFEEFMVSQTPLGRVGQPDDIADIVAFLASEDARWVTGSLIDAAGGWR